LASPDLAVGKVLVLREAQDRNEKIRKSTTKMRHSPKTQTGEL